jgi:hypothetical protein
VENAIVRTPRNYDALRNEHANATGQSASQQDQGPAPRQPEVKNARSELKPSGQSDVRSAPPPWDGTGDRFSEETAAIRRNSWLNPGAIARQGARPDASANGPLAADLQAAKQTGHAAAQQHGADRNASPTKAGEQEKQSGKAVLAEDLKAAKGSGNEVDPSHDPGRSR